MKTKLVTTRSSLQTLARVLPPNGHAITLTHLALCTEIKKTPILTEKVRLLDKGCLTSRLYLRSSGLQRTGHQPAMSSAGEKEESSRLDPSDEKKLGVPKNGGGWWWRLQPFKDNLDNIPAGTFIVSWDGMKGASKLFGYYESAEQYYEQLLVNKEKCGYELLLTGTPWAETLAYGDIEWEGEEDTDHSTARELLRRLHNICATKLGHLLEVPEGEDTSLGGFKPEVYVLCGTRKILVKVVDPETKVVRWVWNGPNP
jgi:hypothetical protein